MPTKPTDNSMNLDNPTPPAPQPDVSAPRPDTAPLPNAHAETTFRTSQPATAPQVNAQAAAPQPSQPAADTSANPPADQRNEAQKRALADALNKQLDMYEVKDGDREAFLREVIEHHNISPNDVELVVHGRAKQNNWKLKPQ